MFLYKEEDSKTSMIRTGRKRILEEYWVRRFIEYRVEFNIGTYYILEEGVHVYVQEKQTVRY